VRRGEVWRYSVLQGRSRVFLIISNDGINISDQPWVLGALVVPRDPDVLLAVDTQQFGWVQPSRIESLLRKHLVERLGVADRETMLDVDSRLGAALDL
jgi:mRNA-degrading endonuclease toxin of MazEF toxin-antitoxin module